MARSLLMLLVLLLAALPVQALDPDKAFHHYVRDSWSIEEGLPQISGLAITQDQQGYLWVGTQAGLARFDGVRFTPFNPDNTPGLPGILVNSLLVDREGRLWIGTYKGLAVREQGRFRAIATAEGDAGAALDVQQVVQAPSGAILASTSRGLFRVSNDQLVRALDFDGPVHGLLARQDDVLAGGRGEVLRLAGDQVERLPLPADAGAAVVTQLVEAQGRLWAGTSLGLFQREGEAWVRYRDDAELARAPIEEIFQDRDGNLWVAMVEHLVRLRDGAVHERIVQEPGGLAIRSAFEDREGNLWLGGQWDGVMRLWNGWTRRYSSREGLEDPTLWSLARGTGGELWVGTNDGLSVLADGRFRQVLTGSDLPHPNAYTLLAEPGQLWIGTRRGATVYRGDGLVPAPELAAMATAQVNGIVRDRNGPLWFATTQGLFRLEGGSLRRYGEAEGLRDPRVRLVYQARDGRLLVGTQAGLFLADGERLRPLGRDAGLRDNLDVTAIHELPDGQLVIGTLSEELFLLDGERWFNFGNAPGLPVNSPFFITDDGRGFLWVAGIRGIYRVPVADLLAMARGQSTTLRGEMLLNERGDRRGGQKGYCCNGAGNAKGFIEDGVLWLPTRDGVVAMATAGIAKNQLAPQSLVERVRIGEQWRDAGVGSEDEWTLPPEARDLGFEFTVLSFQDPRSVDLRYRLVGYDTNWHDVEDPTRRSVGYTNLPPGDYVFEVIGANNDGIWSSEPARRSFRIQPRFHETPLFYALLALLLASLVYAGYRNQQGAHRQQREALEQLVRQRTEALEVANQRLEEASQADPLTGLRNRRYLSNQIPADIAFYDRENLRRGGDPEVMVFALVDIDHFAAINESHSRIGGDRVLQQFALVLGQLVRSGDYLARWSGDQFLLVFRPMPPSHLPLLAERLRKAIAGQRFEAGNGEALPLTCSIGFMECPLSRESRGRLGWEQMVELADRALHHVKRRGGDGWAAFRSRPPAGLDTVWAASHDDPEAAIGRAALEIVGSANVMPVIRRPGADD